jgi:biopolymer transport protein ExbB
MQHQHEIIERIKSALIGLGTLWILVLMVILSVVSIAIMLERLWLYWTLRDDAPALMRDLGRLLRAGDLEGARRRLEASPSAEAAVVVAGLVESEMGVQAAEEAMAGASALQRNRLEKRLAFLGTLGNNAPFIGLFGTVVGIMAAFDELGKSQDGGGTVAPKMVMYNISEALVATAIGIFVAIPAVAAYNAFQRVVKSILANTDALAHVLLAHLKSEVPATAGGEPSARTSNAPRRSEPPKNRRAADKKADKDDDDEEEDEAD